MGQTISGCRRMGRGFAKQFVDRCGRPRGDDVLVPGVPGLYGYNRPLPAGYEGAAFFMVTKAWARKKPTMATIRGALQLLVSRLLRRGDFHTIVMPRIGHGLDGMRWHGAGGVLETIREVVAGRGLRVVCVTLPEDAAATTTGRSEPHMAEGGGSAPESGSEAGDEAGEVPLRERLRDAVARACMRTGRARPDRIAAAIVAGGLARTLRLARKARLQARDRATLRLVEHRIPAGDDGRGGASSEVEALRSAFGDAVAEAAARPADLPDAPPQPEPETEAPGGVPMPLATAAWEAERRRQMAHPFRAGARCEVQFDWVDPPPPPRTGTVWRWGPFAVAGGEAEDLGQLLAKECRQKAIELAGWGGVDVVTPVFIAVHPVSGKKRLVHDLRALCARMRLSTVDYDRAADALLGGTHAVKIDLLSAFRHCALGESDRRRMGFVVGNQVWRWTVLPFGAAQSPELYCAQLAVAVKRLRASGVRLVVYVDDILILANSPEELDAAAASVMNELAGDGWYMALDKAFISVPATVIPFLGVLVDLAGGCLRVSKAKALKFEAYCEAVLQGSGRLRRAVVTLRELQRLGGKLAFLATAAPLAGMMRSALDAATAEAMRLPGRTVALRGDLLEEIRFWSKHARFLPLSPALRQGTAETVTVVTDAAGPPFMGWGVVAWPGRVETPPVEEWLKEGTAKVGDVASGAVAGFGRLTAPVGGRLSSAALEVQGLRRALRWLDARAPGVLRGRAITWYCDAQAATGAVRKWRSKSAGVAGELHRLFELCRQWGCSVRPVWVARELGWQPVADFLSREAARRVNSAEWRLPRATFSELCTQFGFAPRIDLFAAPENAACEQFVAQHPTKPGAFTDAFARPWHGIAGYAFPPFSQATKTMRHMAVARGSTVLCVLPVDTPVPEGVRIVASMPLAGIRLVNPAGREAAEPCPRELRALLLAGPS